MAFIRIIILAFLMAIPAISYAWPIPSSLDTYCERVEPIEAQICAILTEEGLGCEWIALALAESGGDPSNVSSKGAAGLWQLMPATARSFGLRVDSSVDERLDIRKSTRAAARYIRKHLKTFHGSILWAVAAYNAGGSNLRRKTDYQKSMNFDVVKQASYPSYALGRTVQSIMDNGVCAGVDKAHLL